jgi:hypothetical protein
VIDVGVGQKNACDWSVAQSARRRLARLQLRHGFDLAARSGDALIKKQPSKLSVLMAILDCVCGGDLARRAATQLTQEQFHCGKTTAG